MGRSITSILRTTKWEWHNGIVITDYSVVVSLQRKNSCVSQIAIAMKLHIDTAVRSHTATGIIASRPIYSYCDPLLFDTEIIPLFMWLCREIWMCALSGVCWNCSPSELCESNLSIFSGFNYCPSSQHGIRALLFLIFIHPILPPFILWFMGFGLCLYIIDFRRNMLPPPTFLLSKLRQ